MTKSEAEYSGAYLIRGDARTLDVLFQKLIDENVTVKASPDYYVRVFTKFVADDAEEIRRRATLKPIHDNVRLFLISFPSATTEAQNALLKLLEEPGDAVFFLVTPSPDTLLPTIRSRVQTLDMGEAETGVDVESFLSSSSSERLLLLKPLYEHEAGERDIAGILAFLHSLERVFSRKVRSAEAQQGIAAIYRARKFVTDKGSLLKPLLEQIALIAPKV